MREVGMWRFAIVLCMLSGSGLALASGPDVDDVEETVRDVKDLMPEGLSPQTKKKLEIIDGIKDEVDLESPPFDDDDTPQAAKAAVDQLDRKYEEARSALSAISSTDQNKKRVKKAAKWVDEFEAVLSTWTQLLERRNAAEQESESNPTSP